jgi:shikimate 5-dehydrogenase
MNNLDQLITDARAALDAIEQGGAWTIAGADMLLHVAAKIYNETTKCNRPKSKSS